MRISKKYRLTAAAMLAASSVVTVAPGLSHANSMYKDVSPSASYYKDLVELVNQGIISGYADKTFKPDVAVTRGHFAQMLAQLLKLDTSKLDDPYLSDVTPSNPFYKYIAALAGAGVDVAYEDGSFKPNQVITRIEAAQILATALDLKPTTGTANYTDVPAKNQAAVKAIVQNGLMKAPSSKTFNSNGNITRAESVSLLTGIQAFQQDEGTFTFNSLTSAGQVSTSEGTYRLSAEMKKIFNSSNAAALSGAQIKAVISNKQIIKVTGITFNQSGSTYGATTFNAGGAKIEGNVFINADYLRLQNVKINGNVTVSDDAYYNMTLDNVTVKQSVVIEDGYSSSFTFAANNSTIPQLYVKRDNTLVNTDQKITAIVIEGDADDVALNTRVGKVTIAAGMYPTITGYATMDEMIVERGANVDLRVNVTLAELEIVHGDSRVYSNRNLLIADVLIPRGADYTDIIANYSIVNNYIMSIHRPDSTGNLLGINKVPNIPDGALHPEAGGGSGGSNTVITFNQAVTRAIDSFSAVPSGKSITLTTKFNSMDNATKNTLSNAPYNYRIKSRSTLPETAKYTLEIENWGNTYTATVTGKQLNEGITMNYLILKSLGTAVDWDGRTDTWTISVETLNGTLNLEAELLIKDTVAKSATFNLTGTDDGGTGDQTTATVDTAAIDIAISAANTAKTGVIEATIADTVAIGTKWVTTAEMKALTDAITAATNAKTTVKTEADVTNAAKALNTAVLTFNRAKKDGTKEIITGIKVQARHDEGTLANGQPTHINDNKFTVGTAVKDTNKNAYTIQLTGTGLLAEEENPAKVLGKWMGIRLQLGGVTDISKVLYSTDKTTGFKQLTKDEAIAVDVRTNSFMFYMDGSNFETTRYIKVGDEVIELNFTFDPKKTVTGITTQARHVVGTLEDGQPTHVNDNKFTVEQAVKDTTKNAYTIQLKGSAPLVEDKNPAGVDGKWMGVRLQLVGVTNIGEVSYSTTKEKTSFKPLTEDKAIAVDARTNSFMFYMNGNNSTTKRYIKVGDEVIELNFKFEPYQASTSIIGRYEAGTSAQSIDLGTHFSIENGIVKFG